VNAPQIVAIGAHDTTFTAICAACGTTFAGRLDDDLVEGMFLCRSGHPIRIERHEPPQDQFAVA
jgi:hypothetical protein